MSKGSIKVANRCAELVLENTFSIGQVFNWDFRAQDHVVGTLGDKLLELKVYPNGVDWVLSPSGSKEEVEQYLNLNVSLQELLGQWKSDKLFNSLYKSQPGVRILNQPVFECLISFICSQNSHVKRIASNIQSLKQRYGKRICFKYNTTYYSFPTVGELSSASQDVLETLGLGYRAKYIVSTVQQILNKGSEPWLESLKDKSTEDIRNELLKFEGIGPKVADCILLFGFNRFEVVPIDTHMWKIAKQHYGAPNTKSVTGKVYRKTSEAFFNVFGEYAGWAHSILFAASLKKEIPQAKTTKKPRKN